MMEVEMGEGPRFVERSFVVFVWGGEGGALCRGVLRQRGFAELPLFQQLRGGSGGGSH